MIVQAVVALAASAANAGLKNVLFLIADDLRPQSLVQLRNLQARVH